MKDTTANKRMFFCVVKSLPGLSHPMEATTVMVQAYNADHAKRECVKILSVGKYSRRRPNHWVFISVECGDLPAGAANAELK